MLDDNEKTRYDVDRIDVSTVTKQIDMYPSLQSPFTKSIMGAYAESNNLFVNEDGSLTCRTFTGSDTIVFDVELDEMILKQIDKLTLHASFGTDKGFSIDQVGIVDMIQTYNVVEIAVDDTLDVDMDIDLSQVDMVELKYLIGAKRFKVFIDISTYLSMCQININDISLVCDFHESLEEEIDAVGNRLASSLDIYVEGDDLIFDFGAGTSSSDSGSGASADIELIETMIQNALSRCSVDVDFQLLQDGNVKIDAEFNRGD